jgi:hypothetical protein
MRSCLVVGVLKNGAETTVAVHGTRVRFARSFQRSFAVS